jgi:hypothetical protein
VEEDRKWPWLMVMVFEFGISFDFPPYLSTSRHIFRLPAISFDFPPYLLTSTSQDKRQRGRGTRTTLRPTMDNGSDDDDDHDDNGFQSGDDRTMNQQMARHRSATAAAPRGATPRALAVRSSSSSSSTRQRQRQYTAADIDREIAADNDASDDDDDDNSSNGDSDSDNNDGGD